MLIKVSDEKTLYMWSIFLVATALGWFVGWLLPPGFLVCNSRVIIFAALSAVFFTGYHLAAAKAYASEDGDLSLSYPLTTLAPVFISFWAYMLLGDTFTVKVIAGILLTVAGAFCIQLKPSQRRFSLNNIGFKSVAVRFALLASFLYSFGAIADKIGVNVTNFYIFSICLTSMVSLCFTGVVISNGRLRNLTLHCFKNHPFHVFIGGFVLFLSHISYRYALETTQVSYASAVRQIATLFAVLMGIILLKESYGPLRFFASVMITVGIVLIKWG